MKTRPEKLVFIDLETGGLDGRRHPIIELAAIAVDAASFREIETLDFKIQFRAEECSPRSLGKNKFDPVVWETAALEPELAARLFAVFLERNATHTIHRKKQKAPLNLARLVAHNGEQFDGPFLHAWYRRLGIYCPAARQALCTKQRAMWLFEEDPTLPRPRDFKLGTLCRHFGVQSIPDHSALNDIRATVELYQLLQQESARLSVDQRDYLATLARHTGLSWQKLLNRAINGLVSELDLAA